MYPPQIVEPMKKELVDAGFQELLTPEQVDTTVNSEGSVLLVINSVCGCAAGCARPGIKLSLNNQKKPQKLATVFAGVDKEATTQVRKHLLPYPPSSPSIALFKDGKLVHFIERLHIEGRTPEIIADNLSAAYNEFC
jgi:putative YphP/YqiW family bacilliredoxin